MSPFHAPESDVPIATSLLGAFLLVFGLYSAVIKERLYLSEALLATLLGTIIGPHVSGAFKPGAWADVNLAVLEISRTVIALQIMAAVISLPVQYYRHHWKSIVVLVLPVMICSWLISTGIIYGIMGIPFVKALMLGAAVAPTDPILANSIVKGKFADRHVPRHVRHLLSGESACNDCTAAPFLWLALTIDEFGPSAKAVAKHYFLWIILWELVLAALLGVIIGYVAQRALRYSQDHDCIDQENFLTFALALALLTNGAAYLLSMNDFLAVFAAGIAFAWDGSFYEETKNSQIQEVLDNLANSFFFIFFGALIPWSKFFAPGMFIKLFGTSSLIILLRRLPVTFLFSPLLPSLSNGVESLFVGHFGPMAVGTLYYLAVIIKKHPSFEEAEILLSFVVFSSILIHGTTVPMFKIGSAAVRTLSGGGSMRAPRAPSGGFNVASISAPMLQKPVIISFRRSNEHQQEDAVSSNASTHSSSNSLPPDDATTTNTPTAPPKLSVTIVERDQERDTVDIEIGLGNHPNEETHELTQRKTPE